MRRFRLYGISERKKLAKILDSCVENWSSDWFGRRIESESSIDIPAYLSMDDKRKWRRFVGEKSAIVYSLSSGFSKRMAVEAEWCDSIAAKKASPIWEQTIVDCIDALTRQILRQSKNESSVATAEEIGSVECDAEAIWSLHASGYLAYVVTLGQEALTFVLSSEVIDVLLGVVQKQPQTVALASRLNAIGKGVCRFELIAGAAEVSLGELHALSPGHIVQLDKVVGQPFRLRTTEGNEIGNGYLAECDAKKAVHLVEHLDKS